MTLAPRRECHEEIGMNTPPSLIFRIFLENGGLWEVAQRIAGHAESPHHEAS